MQNLNWDIGSSYAYRKANEVINESTMAQDIKDACIFFYSCQHIDAASYTFDEKKTFYYHLLLNTSNDIFKLIVLEKLATCCYESEDWNGVFETFEATNIVGQKILTEDVNGRDNPILFNALEKITQLNGLAYYQKGDIEQALNNLNDVLQILDRADKFGIETGENRKIIEDCIAEIQNA